MTRLSIRIDFNGGQRLGPGKIQLLELVDSCGSITASAKKMNMSYRRAWLLIEELNEMFDSQLVETRPGGRGGGNAKLSLLGRAVIQAYRSLENDAERISSARMNELSRHVRGTKAAVRKEK